MPDNNLFTLSLRLSLCFQLIKRMTVRHSHLRYWLCLITPFNKWQTKSRWMTNFDYNISFLGWTLLRAQHIYHTIFYEFLTPGKYWVNLALSGIIHISGSLKFPNWFGKLIWPLTSSRACAPTSDRVHATAFSLAAPGKILALKRVYITSFQDNLGLWGFWCAHLLL